MSKIAAGSAFLMLGAQPPAAAQGKAVEYRGGDVTLAGSLYRGGADAGLSCRDPVNDGHAAQS